MASMLVWYIFVQHMHSISLFLSLSDLYSIFPPFRFVTVRLEVTPPSLSTHTPCFVIRLFVLFTWFLSPPFFYLYSLDLFSFLFFSFLPDFQVFSARSLIAACRSSKVP